MSELKPESVAAVVSGKAMPADIFTGESLTKYFARKYLDMQAQRDMYRNAEVSWEKAMMHAIDEDGTGSVARAIAELKEQRDALAAENAALISAFMPKEIPTEATDNFSDTAVLRIDGDEFHSWQWVDNQDEVIRGVLNFFKPETPATDAHLNSLRAEGVEMLAANHQRIVDTLNGYSLFADGEGRHAAIAAAAVHFAAQLRAGKDGD